MNSHSQLTSLRDELANYGQKRERDFIGWNVCTIPSPITKSEFVSETKDAEGK